MIRIGGIVITEAQRECPVREVMEGSHGDPDNIGRDPLYGMPSS